jgi:molecular chaperone Hsp33
MVEQFYAQSEQYPLRIKISDNSDTAIGLVALPEFDEEWIQTVDLDSLVTSTEVPRSPMRTVHFAFSCDCSPDKLLPFFRSMSPEAVEELYGNDQELQITCPRCGRQFGVNRSELAEN